MMRMLSNEMLLETYYQAVELRLEEEFIRILLSEIRHRNLGVQSRANQPHPYHS
jgi:developmental checkpoint coupling sporulation initiation to replication initiation